MCNRPKQARLSRSRRWAVSTIAISAGLPKESRQYQKGSHGCRFCFLSTDMNCASDMQWQLGETRRLHRNKR
jgi:hypothetical protein